MAKQIFVKDDDINSILAEIRRELYGNKCYGKVEFRRTFCGDSRRAELIFSPTAWIKMTALVASYRTEVQWHGLVQRINENMFAVYDIIVPPHSVTAATVTSDPGRYSEWLNELDDTTFADLRFHGHSHVDMAVSPSSTDNKYRTDVVTQLPRPSGDEDMFYIFMIMNKRLEWSAEIYDLTNNSLYSTHEIDISVMDVDVFDFIKEARKIATHEVASPINPVTSLYSEHTGKSAHKKAESKKAINDNDDDYYCGIDTDSWYANEGRWW